MAEVESLQANTTRSVPRETLTGTQRLAALRYLQITPGDVATAAGCSYGHARYVMMNDRPSPAVREVICRLCGLDWEDITIILPTVLAKFESIPRYQKTERRQRGRSR